MKNGNIKLGDFGISRVLEPTEKAHSLIGTPYYMSPEVIENLKEGYNTKSDMWAMGCVLYELASFHKPFVGDSLYRIFDAVVKESTPSIISLYSENLNRILKM